MSKLNPILNVLGASFWRAIPSRPHPSPPPPGPLRASLHSFNTHTHNFVMVPRDEKGDLLAIKVSSTFAGAVAVNKHQANGVAGIQGQWGRGSSCRVIEFSARIELLPLENEETLSCHAVRELQVKILHPSAGNKSVKRLVPPGCKCYR